MAQNTLRAVVLLFCALLGKEMSEQCQGAVRKALRRWRDQCRKRKGMLSEGRCRKSDRGEL